MKTTIAHAALFALLCIIDVQVQLFSGFFFTLRIRLITVVVVGTEIKCHVDIITIQLKIIQ